MISIKKIFSYFVIISIMLAVVTGFLSQVQMALFENQVIIPQATTKVLLVAGIAVLLFVSKFELKAYKKLVIYWWLFILFLLIHFIIISITTKLDLTSILFSYNAYYFYLLIIPLFLFSEKNIEENSILKILIYSFLPLAILGIGQFFFNESIVPVESIDGNFVAFSSIWYGQYRAFSLFTSGVEFGNYINIVLPIMLVLLFERKGIKKVPIILLIILVVVASYATLTRNIYTGSLFTSVSAILILFFLKNEINFKYLSKLPYLIGFLGYAVLNGSSIINSLVGGDNAILSTTSLVMRQESWKLFSKSWLGNDVLTALFGTGIIQNDKFESFSSILIDNNFLAIGSHIGLIGLVLWILLMIEMWKIMFKETTNNPSALSIGLTSFFSTWISSGIFNVTIFIYPLVFFLFIIKKTNLNKKIPKHTF